MGPVGVDGDTSLLLADRRWCPTTDSRVELRFLLVEPGVAPVVADREHETAAGSNNVPVAEVPAKQVCISGLIKRAAVTLGALVSNLPPADATPLIQAPPPTNRLDGDAADVRVVTIADAEV
jgi:hypothetical protein